MHYRNIRVLEWNPGCKSSQCFYLDDIVLNILDYNTPKIQILCFCSCGVMIYLRSLFFCNSPKINACMPRNLLRPTSFSNFTDMTLIASRMILRTWKPFARIVKGIPLSCKMFYESYSELTVAPNESSMRSDLYPSDLATMACGHFDRIESLRSGDAEGGGWLIPLVGDRKRRAYSESTVCPFDQWRGSRDVVGMSPTRMATCFYRVYWCLFRQLANIVIHSTGQNCVLYGVLACLLDNWA